MITKEKVSLYADAASEMDFPRLNAAVSRSNGWRIEHDRFLVLATVRLGYGDWSKLRRAMLAAPQFRFDFFLRSRSNNDINKRMRQLRPSIERELGVNIRVFDRDAKTQKGRRRRETEQRNKLRRHLRFLDELKQRLQRETVLEEGMVSAPPQTKRRRVTAADEESTV